MLTTNVVETANLEGDLVAALAEHGCVAKPTTSEDVTPGARAFDIFTTDGELIVDALPVGDLWDFIETDIRCPECGSRDVRFEEGFDAHGDRVEWIECGDCEHCWEHDEG